MLKVFFAITYIDCGNIYMTLVDDARRINFFRENFNVITVEMTERMVDDIG